jgi:hypothetical protein
MMETCVLSWMSKLRMSMDPGGCSIVAIELSSYPDDEEFHRYKPVAVTF